MEPTRSNEGFRPRICSIVVLMMLSAPVFALSSFQSDDSYTERKAAFEAYDEGRMLVAMPLFEALAAKNPSDIVIREHWASSTLLYSATLTDAEQRKRARARARKIGLEAQKLGDNSPFLLTILEVPEDGSEGKYSERPDVEAAMKEAESDFAKGDYDKAREGYIRVLLLDPHNYAAALFIGDVYFTQHTQGSAGEWFSRAIQIDPDRETAYRYWGDALMALGKNDEARMKYIDAVVAEPYARQPWEGVKKWTDLNKTQLHVLKLQDKSKTEVKDEKTINITLDTSAFGKKGDPSSAAWLMYGLSRATWQGDRFKKEFPNEPKYRRTLKEETDCLSGMLTVLKEQKDYKKHPDRVDPTLVELIKIQEAGLLESFVLLNRADNDIAQDYPAYRSSNREKLRAYLDQFVIPRAPSP
jgi:tetratricopeptide (TPR) repeat protein